MKRRKVFIIFDYKNPKHLNKLLRDLDPYDKKRIKEGIKDEYTTWKVLEDYIGVMQDLGFDGVYVDEAGIRNIAVFDPASIESAIGKAKPKKETSSVTTPTEQGAVKEEPKAGARIERKESFRGRTTPDVTYIVYDQDGNRSQTFNKKADAQQHLDLLTLSREDFLNKYPDIRTKVEAVEADHIVTGKQIGRASCRERV